MMRHFVPGAEIQQEIRRFVRLPRPFDDQRAREAVF